MKPVLSFSEYNQHITATLFSNIFLHPSIGPILEDQGINLINQFCYFQNIISALQQLLPIPKGVLIANVNRGIFLRNVKMTEVR